MQLIASDGVSLNYSDQGQGQPVLLLNGIGGYRDVWQLTIPVLLRAGYRVIALDARNQGLSQRTQLGRRMSRHAIDVAELMTQLRLTHVIGVGHSMGASTLWAYTDLFGDGRLAGMVVVDQTPKMINTVDWPFGFKNLTWDSFPERFNYPLGPATARQLPTTIFESLQRAKRQYPYDEEFNRPLLVDHAFQDWRMTVRHFRKRLLIMAGEQSPYFPPSFAKATAELATKGTFQIIADAGHLVMAEQADQFNDQLLTFCQQITVESNWKVSERHA